MQNTISSRIRPRRLIRPRVYNDTITGEWWKSCRVQSLQTRSRTENIPEEESAMLSILEIPEPRSHRGAKNSPHWSDWEKELEDEIRSLHENNVWKVVTRPAGRNIVGGK